MCDVALRIVRPCRVEAFGWGFGVICAFHFMNLLNRAGDQTVPTMVVFGTEECLVHVAVHKFFDKQPIEQVLQGIRLRLEPKLVMFLNVCSDRKGGGFTGVDNCIVVVGSAMGRTPGLKRRIKSHSRT